MTTFKTSKHHWHYFLAIEKDLENLSRYIEFAKENLSVYSIELTRLLLSASSEIDVIMKELCTLLEPNKKAEHINDYREIIQRRLPVLIKEEVSLDRFGLLFTPWDSWTGLDNPNWWRSYNNVKHERNNHFSEANLQNTINAVGALLLTVVHYYKHSFSKEVGRNLDTRDVIRELGFYDSFININADDYRYRALVS